MRGGQKEKKKQNMSENDDFILFEFKCFFSELNFHTTFTTWLLKRQFINLLTKGVMILLTF